MPHYIGLIRKDADSDFGVSFPDFPGAVTAGKTLEEARAMAEEALAFHIEGMIEDGDAVPEPSTLDEVMADAGNRDAVVILVGVTADAAKAVRVNVTFARGVLERIDAFAASHGLSRSGFLARAAERMMEAE